MVSYRTQFEGSLNRGPKLGWGAFRILLRCCTLEMGQIKLRLHRPRCVFELCRNRRPWMTLNGANIYVIIIMYYSVFCNEFLKYHTRCGNTFLATMSRYIGVKNDKFIALTEKWQLLRERCTYRRKTKDWLRKHKERRMENSQYETYKCAMYYDVGILVRPC